MESCYWQWKIDFFCLQNFTNVHSAVIIKINSFRLIPALSFASWDTYDVTIFLSCFCFYCEMALFSTITLLFNKSTLAFLCWYYDLDSSWAKFLWCCNTFVLKHSNPCKWDLSSLSFLMLQYKIYCRKNSLG